MSRIASAKRKPRKDATSTQFKTVAPKLAIVQAAAPEKRVRGVKLKTVSTLTMGFALVCLGAFMAGRPSTSAAGPMATIPELKERAMLQGLRTATYQVNDLARAKEWYSTVLGVKPYFDQPFYVGFNVGGYELGLVPAADAGEKRAPAGIAYWGVKDARDAYQHLLDFGAKAQEPVQDVGEGILIGAVHDPFGNVLGVVQNPNFKAGGD
ncbi:MAG TPA: VOC family protein [Verrucomicrobiae bacterium]|nr:VOC family protein [Verrucomicrobiae bacterium]